jgi:branched-chain amino acid transport system permease protein
LTQFLQNIVDALSVGSTYALLALGMTLLFSVMGLINFAYGDLIVMCGYVLSVLQTLAISFWAAIPILILFATFLSVAIWWLAFKPFHRAPPITLLLTSFGVSLVLESAALLIFGPTPRAFSIPNSLGHVWRLGGVRFPLIEVATIGVGALLIVALNLVLQRTNLGLELLATAEDRPVAELMGVRTNRVVVSAFALSGLLAGIVAVLELPRLGAVTYQAGLNPTIEAFVAIILGGLGSIRGAVFGGLALGALETFFNAWLPNQLLAYQEAFVFLVVMLLLSLRPGGIAGRIQELTR